MYFGDTRDTICALSSAAGRAGIAVVRISGPQCSRILGKSFSLARGGGSELPPRKAVLGYIRRSQDDPELDEVIVTWFPSPKSYTGEDVAEISMHGSPVLVSALLDSLCSHGARLAEPGEFTLRAFLNGRVDLPQAEAVRDIIEARTLYQAQVAFRQRSGELARELDPVKKLLIDLIVQLESAVEFVEEDLPLESREILAAKLGQIQTDLDGWIRSYRRGRLVRDGFNLAIVGRPNVGKSSLFNALLAKDRSIVTEIPGTTRDLVSEDTNIEGVPVRLLDTAGVRLTEDRVELLGMSRSFQAMADADAILLVTDTSAPRCDEDEVLRSRMQGLEHMVVMNKSDLPCAWSESQKLDYAGNRPVAEVSAMTGANIEDLRRIIFRQLLGDESVEKDGLLITNLRHCRCLEEARASLGQAASALRAGLSEEFVLVGLHNGLNKLGEITGEFTVEDLLGQIFSRFCVGK